MGYNFFCIVKYRYRPNCIVVDCSTVTSLFILKRAFILNGWSLILHLWRKTLPRHSSFLKLLCFQSLLDDGFLVFMDHKYSHQSVPSSSAIDGSQAHFNTEIIYCYCQKEEYGDLVGCDNAACKYQWFHLDCLKLKTLPKSSKWFCPDCRKVRNNKK